MYIDSNIFIFAATDNGGLGKKCREIISLINNHKITGASSFLVIDEVMWIVKKHVGREDAVAIIKAMLSLPVKWIEVDKSVIIKMTDVFENSVLDPRDAAHVASMKELGLSSILSEDADFDAVNGVERVTVAECIEKNQ